MQTLKQMKRLTRNLISPIATKLLPVSWKEFKELHYWKSIKKIERVLSNDPYKHFYTTHFGLDDSYYNNKIILDIGYGPRASLEWASMAWRRIGLDPVAKEYLQLGANQHKKEYIDSPSENIPLKDADPSKNHRVFMSARTVSIITPTFNHENFIADCIESVLRQTYKHWEMIIIDDGSCDGTREIIQQYNDSRIIFIPKDHKGINCLGENYNQALKMSQGEYILILEGDDFLPPNRIELQLPSFEDESVVLSHGKYAYVFDDRVVVYPNLFKIEELRNRPIGSALKIFLQGFNPIGSQSVMIRKSALLDIGGFTQPKYLPLVDYPTWMKLALRGTFEYIPEVLGFWRRHPQSVTINRNEEIFKAFIQYCNDFVESYGEELIRLGLSDAIQERGAIANLSLAWIKLSKRSWAEAIEFSKRSWASRRGVGWNFKAKILIGLIGAYLHKDLPSYFKKMNQWLYRKEIRE
jgi:glycosyltransferase involved in cell wall biosynthesis